MTLVCRCTLRNQKIPQSIVCLYQGDGLRIAIGMNFTTHDADHDHNPASNCAKLYRGGYWYNNCDHCNLNGVYNKTTFGQGVNWDPWRGAYYSLKSAEMKIRPVC